MPPSRLITAQGSPTRSNSVGLVAVCYRHGGSCLVSRGLEGAFASRRPLDEPSSRSARRAAERLNACPNPGSVEPGNAADLLSNLAR